MRSVTVGRLVAATAALLTLAACSSGAGSSYAAPPAASAAASSAAGAAAKSGGIYGDGGAATTPASGAASGAALMTATTSLGTIVVGANGKTVYRFDKDKQGTTSSACTGGCAGLWPAVPAGSMPPQVTGLTGAVATITGVDGQPQLTLDGWPLYYYAADTAAGQVNGQGFGGIWWAVTPAGAKAGG
jgi:predicted lipoprotein with Yx(FWY)xxD motif